MNAYADKEPLLKTTCSSIIVSLCQIDSKVLEAGVAKLDFTKKTPIRKIMIEFENQAQKGGNLQVLTGNEQALVADAGGSDRSPEQSMRDTQQSFTSLH